jgi:hypothetical protein
MNRRDFLRSSACVGALAAAPLALRPRTPIIRDGEVFTWTDTRPMPPWSRLTNCVIDVHETIEMSDRCVIQACVLNIYGGAGVYIPSDRIDNYVLSGNYVDVRCHSIRGCTGPQNTVPRITWNGRGLVGYNRFGGVLDEVARFDVKV